MKTTIRAAAAVVTLSAASAVHAQQVAPFHRPIGFSEQANIRRQNIECPGFTNGQSYPLGTAWYLGVRFEHGPADRYAFMGGNYCGGEPRALEVVVWAPGSGTLSVLLNSWNGCSSGPDFLATATFLDGSSRSWVLRHGIDYRDHNGTSCPLTGNRSQQVWTSGSGQRLDLLTLPLERPGTALATFRIESTVPMSPLAAPFVFGITASDSTDCNADGIADYGQILDGTFPDANGNGIPDCCDGGGSCCPGDVASDGMVDGVDLAAVLSQWGTQGSGTFNADIDGSGLVDGGDLGIVLGGWGPCPN
jgi:hypothetical protein